MATILVLLIWNFPGCKPSTVEQPKAIVIDSSVIKERDAYKDSLAIYKTKIDNSKVEKDETEKLLKKADVQLKGLIVKYNQAVIAANVPQIRETCDSIVLENLNLFEINAQYQNDMNQLIDYYELALKASDSAAIKSNYLLIASNKSLIQTTNDYNDLAKVYNKKTKRQSDFNKVLAGAVLVLGGIVLVK